MENVIKNRSTIITSKVGKLSERGTKINQNKFIKAITGYFRELKTVYETANFAAVLP